MTLFVTVAGCGARSASDPTWVDVAPILEGRCTSCHGDGGSAPFPLDTWSSASIWSGAVAVVIEAGTMPPWGAAPASHPYVDDPTLSPREVRTLLDWVAAGAPLGAADPGEVLEAHVPTLERVDATLSTGPYVPSGDPDDYRCFVLGTGMSGYATAFAIVADEPATVHHATLSTVATDDDGDKLRALEDEDADPGFDCNEGKSSDTLGGPETELFGSLPGRGPTWLFENTGIPLDPAEFQLLTVHYNVAGGVEGGSAVHVLFTLEDEVDRAVDRLKLLPRKWKHGAFVVPPGSVVDHTAALLVADLDLDSVDPTRGLRLQTVGLHMHRHGVSGQVDLRRADGAEEVLLDVPAWDFDWQLEYVFETPVDAPADSELVIRCRHENVEGTQAIGWGEDSEDEMCGATLFVSEP